MFVSNAHRTNVYSTLIASCPLTQSSSTKLCESSPEEVREANVLKWTVFSVLIAVSVTPVPAQASSLEEAFYSDETLVMAQSDVSKMDIDELRLFAQYQSQCTNNLSQNELIQNACDSARERYAIEYNRHRSLDRLLVAIDITERILRSSDKLGERDEKLIADVKRLGTVKSALRDATNTVFYLLRREHEPN